MQTILLILLVIGLLILAIGGILLRERNASWQHCDWCGVFYSSIGETTTDRPVEIRSGGCCESCAAKVRSKMYERPVRLHEN